MMIKSDAVAEEEGLGGENVNSELETDAVLAGTSENKSSSVKYFWGKKRFRSGGRGKDMDTHDEEGCSGGSSQDSLCRKSQMNNESWVSRSAAQSLTQTGVRQVWIV